jgi:hypothetical protein
VRVFKLALRMVLAWRGSVYAAVAAVALVAGIVTLAGAVWVPVRAGTERSFRREVAGELEASIDPGRAGAVVEAIEQTGGLASIVAREAGALDGTGTLLLVRVERGDLRRELAFRGRLGEVQANDGGGFAANDAVLLTDGERPSGRVLRLWSGGESRLIRVVALLPQGASGPALLLHEPGVVAAPHSDTLIVRARGEGEPLGDAQRYLETFGLHDTGWNEASTHALAPLVEGTSLLALTLAVLAVVTLLPGTMLLVRRARPSLALLFAWGFGRETLRLLVVLIGALSAAFAAAVGGSVALGVATVMNARGRPAIELLPLDIAQRLRPYLEAGSASVTPSVEWAIACVAAATLLGALTALPSVALCDRLIARQDLWHR